MSKTIEERAIEKYPVDWVGNFSKSYDRNETARNEYVTICREQRTIDEKELQPQWISVDDMLPESYELEIVVCKDLSRYIAFVGTGGSWYDNHDLCKIVGVTHWMSLSELPKSTELNE